MNEIKIEKLDNTGRGICYINDKITFVENALPDEIVNIKITKESKKSLLKSTPYFITSAYPQAISFSGRVPNVSVSQITAIG